MPLHAEVSAIAVAPNGETDDQSRAFDRTTKLANCGRRSVPGELDISVAFARY